MGSNLNMCSSPSTWSTFTLHQVRVSINCKIIFLSAMVQFLDDFQRPLEFHGHVWSDPKPIPWRDHLLLARCGGGGVLWRWSLATCLCDEKHMLLTRQIFLPYLQETMLILGLYTILAKSYPMVCTEFLMTEGHARATLTHKTECPWPLHFKHSRWWKKVFHGHLDYFHKPPLRSRPNI